jgi:hypothetical protein
VARPDLEQRVNKFAIGSAPHQLAPLQRSNSFLHQCCAGAFSPQTPEVKEKDLVPQVLQVLTKVIAEYDDVHRHLRLDFFPANAHCDLVQRNNVA